MALAVEATHVVRPSAGIVDHSEKGHKQFVDKFGGVGPDKFGVQGAAQRKKA